MNNTKLIIINVGVAAIALLIWWVTSNWKTWGENDDLGMQFVGMMALTIVFGVLFVTIILPQLGDKIGDMFYSAPEKSEPDAYAKAAAKVMQGDYLAAIEDYKAIAIEEPDSHLPHLEIAKLQEKQLRDVDGAIATLESTVQMREWEVDDAAFMIFRLHELYLEEKNNPEKAREFLELAIEKFPDTRHSANAHHKLNALNSLG